MTLYKEISDIDQADDNTYFGIEWQFADGHREWEWFKTYAERKVALENYALEVEANENVDTPLGEQYDGEGDQFLSDAEADADVLRSAGWGTDEDYGGDCEHF